MNSTSLKGPRAAPDVLVVEDDTELRAAICETLSSHEMSAVGVPDGAAALDYLSSSPAPRLIVTDIEMPVMTGWELLEEIRARGLPAMPVIVLSAFVDDAVLARPDGLQFHIRKPFAAEGLVGYARRFCRR